MTPMTTDDVQYLDWQWVEENPESALDLMLKLHRENAALRKENEALHKTLSAALDAARKEDQS